jgi:hypothetical protein
LVAFTSDVPTGRLALTAMETGEGSLKWLDIGTMFHENASNGSNIVVGKIQSKTARHTQERKKKKRSRKLRREEVSKQKVWKVDQNDTVL